MNRTLHKIFWLILLSTATMSFAAITLPRVDKEIVLGPYTVKSDEMGDFMVKGTFKFGMDPKKTYYVVGSQITALDSAGATHPGLHHAISAILPNSPVIGDNISYALPGNTLRVYADGYGKAVKGGATISFSVHMNIKNAPQYEGQEFTVHFRFMLADTAKNLIYDLVSTAFDSAMLKIPAGVSYYSYSYLVDPFKVLVPKGKNLTYSATVYHMHQWGIGGSVDKVSKNGQGTPIHATTDYSFANQKNYIFSTPQNLTPGIKVRAWCYWDNSQENQPYVDGVQMEAADVHFGESSFEEMCFNILTLSEPNPGYKTAK